MSKQRHLPGRMTKQALKALFSKPSTPAYPNDEWQLPPGYRGKLVYNAANCTSCQVCIYDCPTQALKAEYVQMPAAKQFTLTLNLTKCIFCGQCADSCPNDCLQLSPQVELGSLDKEELEQVRLGDN